MPLDHVVKKTNILKTVGICLAMVVVGLGGAFMASKYLNLYPHKSGQQILSSTSMELGNKAKAGSSVISFVEAVDGMPTRNDQDLRLRVRARVNIPFNGTVKYKWTLLDSKLVAGDIEGEWTSVGQGQEVSAEIVLLNASTEEPRNILVDVYYLNEKQRIVQSTSVFSTQDPVVASRQNLTVQKTTDEGPSKAKHRHLKLFE